MRFHCVGVGSIGSFLAFQLRRANLAPHYAFTIHARRQVVRRQLKSPDASQIFVETDGVRRVISGFDVVPIDYPLVPFELLHRGMDAGRLFTKQTSSNGFPSSSSSYEPPAYSLETDSPIIESLICSSKATAVLRTLQHFRTKLDASSTVLLLQNGMGIYEEACNNVFPDPAKRPNFVIGSTTHGVWSKRPFDVVHAGQGDLQFSIVPDPFKRRQFEGPEEPEGGLLSSRLYLDPNNISSAVEKKEDPQYFSLAETVRALLRCNNELDPRWITAKEMQIVQRRKLAVNACIGPLTGLLNCQNGATYGTAYSHSIVKGICSEASHVFAAQAEEEEAAQPGDRVNRAIHTSVPEKWHRALNARTLEETVYSVMRSTSKNFSSMLMDVRNGKRTEVEYINGWLHREAKRLGISTPINDTVLNLMRLKRLLPNAEDFK